MIKFQENINGKLGGEQGLVFDIASITKVFTTILICIAVEKDLLKLDDLVYKFLPNFAQSQLTIQDLLIHKAEFGVSMGELRARFTDLKQGISELQIVGGERMDSNYQNLTFIYLGLVLEKIYSKSLGDIFRDFFANLGLNETFCGDDLSGCKFQFVPTEGEIVGTTHDESARIMGGIRGNAGIFSTAKDLGILAQKLLRFEILSEEFVKTHLLKNYNSSTRKQSLGFWLEIPSVKTSLNLLSHTGFTGGLFAIDFENQKFAIYLTNRTIMGREYQEHKKEWQKLIDNLSS